jgi:hypothetical protein
MLAAGTTVVAGITVVAGMAAVGAVVVGMAVGAAADGAG